MYLHCAMCVKSEQIVKESSKKQSWKLGGVSTKRAFYKEWFILGRSVPIKRNLQTVGDIHPFKKQF